MKTYLRNKIKKMLEDRIATSLLITHIDNLEQIHTATEICRIILQIPKEKVLQTHEDIFGIWPEHIINDSIKIEQIHEFIRKAQLKPYASSNKVGLILHAEKMTHDSQNALLKTLEEPPSHTFLILTAKKVSYLLPTIVSRCQVIELHVSNDQHTFDQQTVNMILTSSLIDRFEFVEKIVKMKDIIKRNEQINELLSFLQYHFRKEMLSTIKDNVTLNENLSAVHNVELTIKAIKGNVNVRLALENLMIQLPHSLK